MPYQSRELTEAVQKTAAGKPRTCPPCCWRGLSGLCSIFSTEFFSRSTWGQARRAFGLGLKHPFNLCANLPRKRPMHQELQTKPTRFPFLTCRQIVLEALPPTPSTTATALGDAHPAGFTCFPEKPQSSPKSPQPRAPGMLRGQHTTRRQTVDKLCQLILPRHLLRRRGV